MGRLVVVEHLTLDGVMQAPARPDEDTRGGFTEGGWSAGYQDPIMGATMAKGMMGGGALLLGRRTYEDFFKVWPGRRDNPFTDILNRMTKYVTSRTAGEDLPWENSVLLKGDAAETVAALKARSDETLTVLGSGVLVRSLIAANLVDEFLLTIHPPLLGLGQRLFADAGSPLKLKLLEAIPTSTGVVIGRYQPEPTG
jgi:dihydrofolate reductase